MDTTPDGHTIQSLYAPNQPYFPGLHTTSFANPTIVAMGVDAAAIKPLRPPFPIPPSHLACPDFFTHFPAEIFETDYDGTYWKYSMRREAQRILPWLYLGPANVARDARALREMGITLLLGVRSANPAHAKLVDGSRAAGELGILCEHVAVEGMAELVRVLPQLISGINAHVCQCGRHGVDHQGMGMKRVLVFCETGNERSLAVVVSYVMAMLGMDLATAAHNVQARRMCANFDVNQRDMLDAFETVLVAQRDVAKQNQIQVQTPMQQPSQSLEVNGGMMQARRKRSFVETDMPLDDAIGSSMEPEGRQQPPPFCEKGPW